MCGICSYIGYNNAFDYCYLGILKLLNRGYDAIGISTIKEDLNATSNTSNEKLLSNNLGESRVFKIVTSKYASIYPESIESKILKYQCDHNGSIGISHSRWRTTGGNTNQNSHPHSDMYNKFSLVHNGIIENYAELKQILIKNGFTFKSETDSEVVVNLISYYYNITNDQIEAINLTLKDIEGTYALVILCSDTPNKLYCVRNGSPLLIGFDNDLSFGMIVSEKYGFDRKITKYLCVKNNDIIVLKQENNRVTLTSFSNLEYDHNHLDIVNECHTCEPYKHWTLKEINEQTLSCMRAINMSGRILDDYDVILGGLYSKEADLKRCDNIVFLGCGTSYHAGLFATHVFKKICNFNTVQCFDAGEFKLNDIPKIGTTAVIFISQSGETKDLHRCLELCKNKSENNINSTNVQQFSSPNLEESFVESNIITIGVVNVVDSLIARETDCGVYLNCGKEFGVASTKAFSSQIIVLILIACWFSKRQYVNKNFRKPYLENIRKLQTDIQQTIENNEEICKYIAKFLKSKNTLFILGKETLESIAKEGALKIKELGYIHAEGYSSSALKHGPYTLVINETPVILLTPNDNNFVRNQGTFEELKSREAIVIGVSDTELSDRYDFKLKIPKNSFFELLSIIPLQLIGYYLALEKGHNPDFLRGLAKTVTTD